MKYLPPLLPPFFAAVLLLIDRTDPSLGVYAFAPISVEPAAMRRRSSWSRAGKGAAAALRKYPVAAATAGDSDSVRDSSRAQSRIHPALVLLGKTTSSAVSLAFFAFLAYRRDTYMVSFFIGAIANGVLSKLLKRVLDQDRPVSDEGGGAVAENPVDKGMPSSHAMSLGFLGTFTALGTPCPALAFPFLTMYAAASLSYRIRSGLHTPEQVVVGTILGVINGWTWRRCVAGGGVGEWVGANLLPSTGVMPFEYLALPALVGLAVVGSLERRIGQWRRRRGGGGGGGGSAQ